MDRHKEYKVGRKFLKIQMEIINLLNFNRWLTEWSFLRVSTGAAVLHLHLINVLLVVLAPSVTLSQELCGQDS